MTRVRTRARRSAQYARAHVIVDLEWLVTFPSRGRFGLLSGHHSQHALCAVHSHSCTVFNNLQISRCAADVDSQHLWVPSKSLIVGCEPGEQLPSAAGRGQSQAQARAVDPTLLEQLWNRFATPCIAQFPGQIVDPWSLREPPRTSCLGQSAVKRALPPLSSRDSNRCRKRPTKTGCDGGAHMIELCAST